MMFEKPAEDPARSISQEDAMASGIRVLMSALPLMTALPLAGPIGVIAAEFLTQFVPRQRADRLTDFVEQLADRLRDLEEEFRGRLETSAAFAALTEEAILAAARSPSAERRKELAEILRTGLSRDEAELVEHQALLQVLQRLNDPQVLMLMDRGNFRQTFGETEREAFHKQHAAVFDVRPPDSGASDDEARRWVMYRHYEDELVALGLLRDQEGMVKSSHRRKVAITDLGRLLLSAISKTTTDARS
jgi:hypothetical protein